MHPVHFPMDSSRTLRENHIRTPSPTPSEAKELKTGAIDWKSLTDWRFWIRKEWLWYYIILIIILVVTILITVFHTQIVHWLTPTAQKIYNLPGGWAIPIAVLFILSFPPLFGHEIVAILCGVVWGLWIGFAIVVAGTFIGEVGNFYAFKACCRSRGEKLERTKISYACLAKVVREGGFKIALIARLSAIPGHFTTAIFSTCGMGIIVFSLAALLSMPKQFITVYIGVVFEQSGTGTTTTKNKIISDVVIAITIIITVLAMWYILHAMNKVKPEIIYKKRRARIGKLAGLDTASIDSDTIPLTTPDTPYQNWDRRGAPSTSEVELFAPVPERVGDYSRGYEMLHGRQRPRDEEEVEWDMSSSAYAGIEEDPGRGPSYNVGGLASAASSTATLYAPTPQRNTHPDFLSSAYGPSPIQTRQAGGASLVAHTPTQESFSVSLDASSQNDGERRAVPSFDAAQGRVERTSTVSKASEEFSNPPYQSVVGSSSQPRNLGENHKGMSPPPNYST